MPAFRARIIENYLVRGMFSISPALGVDWETEPVAHATGPPGECLKTPSRTGWRSKSIGVGRGTCQENVPGNYVQRSGNALICRR